MSTTRTILIVGGVVLVLAVVAPILVVAAMMAGCCGMGWQTDAPMLMPMIGWPILLGLLVLVAIVLAATWALRQRGAETASAGEETPLAILQRRYARGELDREEYERTREDLLRDRSGR